MTTEQITKRINDLSADVLVATNDGTHGKDGQFFTWKTFERLDGTRYTRGSDPDDSPGHARYFTPMTAIARREKIVALKIALQANKMAVKRQEAIREQLSRGWDGFQFVGIAEGQRRLAAMNR